MRIAVLGCGNAGTTVAGDLALKGHDVILCKTSNITYNEHFNCILNNQEITLFENEQEYTCKVTITDNMEYAIRGRELIIIFILKNTIDIPMENL